MYSDYIPYSNLPFNDFPVENNQNLITGVGHGHARKPNRERPENNHLKNLKKKTKMAKASKRRNRK